MFSKKIVSLFLCALTCAIASLKAAPDNSEEFQKALPLANDLLQGAQTLNLSKLPTRQKEARQRLASDFNKLKQQIPMPKIIQWIFNTPSNKLSILQLGSELKSATIFNYLLFFLTLHCIQVLIITKSTSLESMEKALPLNLTNERYEAIVKWMHRCFSNKKEAHEDLYKLFIESNAAYKKLIEEEEEDDDDDNCLCSVFFSILKFVGG